MYVDENTSQAASVEFVRLQRTNYARSRLQNAGGKAQRAFSTSSSHTSIGVAFLRTLDESMFSHVDRF